MLSINLGHSVPQTQWLDCTHHSGLNYSFNQGKGCNIWKQIVIQSFTCMECLIIIFVEMKLCLCQTSLSFQLDFSSAQKQIIQEEFQLCFVGSKSAPNVLFNVSDIERKILTNMFSFPAMDSGHLNEVLSKIDIWQLLMIIVAFHQNCTQLLNFFTRGFILQSCLYLFCSIDFPITPGWAKYLQSEHISNNYMSWAALCLFHCKYI